MWVRSVGTRFPQRRHTDCIQRDCIGSDCKANVRPVWRKSNLSGATSNRKDFARISAIIFGAKYVWPPRPHQLPVGQPCAIMPHLFHPSRRARGERLEPKMTVQLVEITLQQQKLGGIRGDIQHYGIRKRGGNGSIFSASNGYLRNDEVIAGKFGKVQPAAIRK